MRDLREENVFPNDLCPVCGHDGMNPQRRKAVYIVPEHGFTTDLTSGGEELHFDKPERIPTSRVLFVPPQEVQDPFKASIGSCGTRVEVRTSDNADFFVFNDGDDPSRRGFCLCNSCGRQVTLNKQHHAQAHKTPYGRDCQGKSYDWLHLGHDFRSCAATLVRGDQSAVH